LSAMIDFNLLCLVIDFLFKCMLCILSQISWSAIPCSSFKSPN